MTGAGSGLGSGSRSVVWSWRLGSPLLSSLLLLAGPGIAVAAPAGKAAAAPSASKSSGPPPSYAQVPQGFPAYPDIPAPLPPIGGDDPGIDLTPVPDEQVEDPLSRIRDLEMRLEQTRELINRSRPSVNVGGYVDFGFFVPSGNGSGIVRDNGNMLMPQYAGRYGWVFLGDILSPAVNSRGEVADLGDAAGVDRFDSIHSQGAPGFVANEVNLTLTSALAEHVIGTASVNFVPRTGSNFSLGDFLDVDLAQLEWVLGKEGKTSVFVGKTESLIGIEYRDRKANNRFGVTPSLIARYTTGTALGLKMRSKFGPDDLFVLAGAVTNGSNTVEQFHFYNEIDTNVGKTVSGRFAIHPPFPFDLEAGVSGSYGAQDRALDSEGKMWFFGVDLLAHAGPVDLKAQYLKGKAPGQPLDQVYGLDLHGGGYVELDCMLTPWLGLLGRGEYRDALVWLGDATSASGANRLYVTKSWRATGGARIVFNDHIVLKAEYLRNGEYGGIPEIKNDVFTSSLVFSH